MDKNLSQRRGGPRSFDRDQAVMIAMHLFWRHGYEGVSISDLTDAIGIAPPSLYAAFGNKESLYRETLDLYGDLPGALTDIEAGQTLGGTIEALLRNAVSAVTDPRGEGGCMISTGLVQCGAAHNSLAAHLAERRDKVRQKISIALKRWLDEKTANSMARYVVTVLQGLAVQARDGVSRAELETVVEEAMKSIRLADAGH